MTREEFIVFQESSFDSFCKSVIRNESVTAHREQKRKIEHEILYSMISEERLLELSAEDQYVLSDQVFYVNGNPVPVCDPVLGDYLAILPPDVRNVLLMDFFWDYSDAQIGRTMDITPQAVGARRRVALKRLRELLEDDYEK